MRPTVAAPPGWAPAAVGLVAFAVYAALCLPVSGPGDGSEFTLVLATGGVAHPTGYPLYTLFGHAFVVLAHALGAPWPLAANLWSAVGAAVAVAFLFALATRLAATERGASPLACALAALAPTALFAFQPILRAEAASAEINSWSVAWVCVAAWLFARLASAIEPATPAPRLPAGGPATRGALLWGLVVGAGLGHHLTSLFVSAPLTAVLAWRLARARRPPGPAAARVAAAACLPLASYGYVAWRAWHPGIVDWPDLAPSLASVWAHVTGEQYRPFLGRFAPAPDQVELLARYVVPFLTVGLAALVVGLVRARSGSARAIWLGMLAAAALTVGFTLRYGVPDPAPYFLPAMALGAAGAAPALLALAAPRRRGGALRLGVAAAAALAVAAVWIDGGVTGRRHALVGEAILRSMWSAVPSDSAIVFYPDDRFYHLREYQILGGEKPSVLVLCPDLLLADGTRAELVRRYGFDPLTGYSFPTTAPGDPAGERLRRAHLRELMHRLNDRVRAPVIVFDPSVPIVQELRKRALRG